MAIVGYPELVMLFTSTEGYGWSETYRWAGITDGNLLTSTFNAVVALRVAWLPQDCRCVRFRLQSQFKRDPLIYSFDQSGRGIGTYPGSMNNTDNALLIRSERVGVGYNQQLCRGVPDALVNQNIFTPDEPWQTAFNAWAFYVRNSGNFGVEANVDNPQTAVQAVSLSMNVPKGIRAILTEAIPDPLPTRVRISGASVFGYNGVKNVVRGPTAAAPLQYIFGGAKPPADNPVPSVTFVTPLRPLFGAVQQYFVERFTTRKAGRPFGQRPGRARTRLSLRP